MKNLIEKQTEFIYDSIIKQITVSNSLTEDLS